MAVIYCILTINTQPHPKTGMSDFKICIYYNFNNGLHCDNTIPTLTSFMHNLKPALTPNLLFMETPHMQTYWCVLSVHKYNVNMHER